MTRMKSGARITLVLLAALGVAACDSFLDVNKDPNSPESVDMRLTLPGILINFAHDILGPTSIRYNNLVGATGWGTEWTQQWSDNNDRHTYAQFQWYDVANQDSDSYWSDSYSRVMNQASNLMRVAAETEQWHHHGIAKLITAWNMSLITDAFGPAPFSEAFDPTNRNPAYDSQEEIYAAVFRLVDEAIDEMQMTDPDPPLNNDVLNQGDMDAWIRLAHSLKGRFHMRLVYAPGENSEARAQQALDALALGIRSPEQAPTISYPGDDADQENPWDTYDSGGYGARTRSSGFFIEMLKEHEDPRLPIMARPADRVCPEELPYSNETDCRWVEEGEIVYRGNWSGGPGEPDSVISRIGEFFNADSADHVWFTYEDTKFLEAEARLILSGPGAADAPYREGIRANMERLGVAPADIDAYLAALPPLGAEGTPIEELITEKFKANFLRDEVWHDYRRTGYPVVPLVEERFIDGIPQRIRTPADEVQFNSDQVAATGIPTGLGGMLTKVWWASGSGPEGAPPGFF